MILRVASSSRKIRVKEFHKFNQETYENLLLLFPWMDIQDSVHGLFHSAQFIEKFNDSYGLAQLSESALGKFKATFILDCLPYLRCSKVKNQCFLRHFLSFAAVKLAKDEKYFDFFFCFIMPCSFCLKFGTKFKIAPNV